MWAHYGDHHRGVCLEFDAHRPDICNAVRVQYREKYPPFRIDHDKDVTPLYTKSADWQYENEYRLIAEEERAAFRDGTIKTRDQFFTLPDGWLTSVIIGAKMPNADRDAIEELVSRSKNKLLIREAKPASDRYELVIEPPIEP